MCSLCIKCTVTDLLRMVLLFKQRASCYLFLTAFLLIMDLASTNNSYVLAHVTLWAREAVVMVPCPLGLNSAPSPHFICFSMSESVLSSPLSMMSKPLLVALDVNPLYS